MWDQVPIITTPCIIIAKEAITGEVEDLPLGCRKDLTDSTLREAWE